MTKKFAVATDSTGATHRTAEFVLPNLPCYNSGGFVGLKSGCEYPAGMIIYTGAELSVDEVLSKAEIEIPLDERTHRMIRSYLDQISSQKVGDVVSVSVSPAGEVTLTKVPSPSRSAERRSKLP